MFFGGYFYILIPSILISLWAQMKVKSTFAKYSKVISTKGYTGEQVARMLLDSSGLQNIPIEMIRGKLADHYDPIKKVMRLSQEVYSGTSVASIGVAAHETGHAIQHKESYSPLILRNSIFPVVNISSSLSWGLVIIGIFIGSSPFINLGIILFTVVVAFQLITLPVEFNASNRAIRILENRSILVGNELEGARAVLSAAAMTYVAAVISALLQLLRLTLISRDR
ncbi:MAG: zinc metallopeptidase [Clostridiaceae bacterium]|nr:zinc metallopeptidase [Clostridiaceae bacterium]